MSKDYNLGYGSSGESGHEDLHREYQKKREAYHRNLERMSKEEKALKEFQRPIWGK